MKNIISIDNEINILINEFSIRTKEDTVLCINVNENSNLKNIITELGFKYKDININKENFYNGLSGLRKIIVNNYINMVVLYDVNDLSYSEISILSSILFNFGIKEVILVKVKNKDKNILKAFLLLYQPYRAIKKALLLRRISSYEYMHYF